MTTREARTTGDLRTRVASAIVLGPAVLAIVWMGGLWFALLAAATAAAIVWEWSRICRGRGDAPSLVLGAGGAAAAVLCVWSGYWGAGIVLAVACAVGAQIAAGASDPGRLMWLGVFYAALASAALVVLRAEGEPGRTVLFWLLLVVWATDIGGYFVGRAIGGPKLWPAVSPKKTWAGAVGGAIAAVTVGSAFLAFAASPALGAATAALAVVLSVAAQLGDLAESALKRRFGVKDSSSLIPGHGGVMDRVDGLVAAGMLAAAIGVARGGADAAGSGLLIW